MAVPPFRGGSKQKARALRRRQTEHERLLWKRIRNRKLQNLKFRRQVPIGSYIVDFACMEKRLVIEVDGTSHANTQQYDLDREEYLRTRGFMTVRFTNRHVHEAMDWVLGQIAEAAELCSPPPSPEGRGLG